MWTCKNIYYYFSFSGSSFHDAVRRFARFASQHDGVRSNRGSDYQETIKRSAFAHSGDSKAEFESEKALFTSARAEETPTHDMR